MTKREVSEEFTTFLEREEAHYCIHAKAALKLSCVDFNVNDTSDSGDDGEDGEHFVDILSTTPLLAVAYTGSYGFISQQKQSGVLKFHCSQCTHKGCDHLSKFLEWCESNGLTEETVSSVFEEDNAYSSQSFRKIPYPLPDHLKVLHDVQESGKQQFPIDLIPPMQDSTCSHGNQ